MWYFSVENSIFKDIQSMSERKKDLLFELLFRYVTLYSDIIDSSI